MRPTSLSDRRPGIDLFVISALGLFLELVLIRWLASEVRVFAYFKNFALFAAFIGLGLGLYVADRRRIRWWWSVVLLVGVSLVALLSSQLHLVNLFFPDPSLDTWRGSIVSPHLEGQLRSYPVLGSLADTLPRLPLLFLVGLTSFSVIALLFTASALIFYPIGQETGRLFGKHRPLASYSINVGGALLGSAAFTLVSYMGLGPLAWLLPCFLFLAYFAWTRGARVAMVLCFVGWPLLAGVSALAVGSPGERLIWSPYYRISLTPGIPDLQEEGYTLRVNHDYFQRAMDLSDGAVRESGGKLEAVATYYNMPYRLLGNLDRVLVVGSGMGNDTSAALRAGARSVTAVDIDPAILRLGTELHPENPYGPGRASTVVNDARAFFRKHHFDPEAQDFDLVVFGLLDSQTALSSMSSVRLEFYVYTMESLHEALSLVDDDHGLLVMTFAVGWRTWVGQRLYETLAEAAGYPPLALRAGGYDSGITYVAGPGLDGIDRTRLADIGAEDVTAEYAGGDIPACYDDWPFLYVNPYHWPWVYLCALGLLLIVGSISVRRSMNRTAPEGSRIRAGLILGIDAHMFLMGAAFMLVETSAIARVSLLFGATWVVNAAVILSVMVMILVANALVETGKAPRMQVSYALLIATLVAVYFTPFDAFLTVNGGGILASLILALPVLFSSLVFANAFSETPSSHIALGCNMLGVILGGTMEAVSLATGIRALSLVAAGVYIVSMYALWWQRRAWPAPAGT